MTHVIHKSDPIPLAEINTSQIEARELRRKMMGNYAEEGVTAVIKTMDKETVEAVIKNTDEDRIIHDLSEDLTEEIYLTALELMKEHFEDVHFYWNHNYNKAQYEFGVILSHSIWNAIEAEAKRQSETTNS